MNPDPEQTLEDFQAAVAAAEAWQAIGHMEILEMRQESRGGRALVNAVKFRRLR